MKLIYLKSALKFHSFDVTIGIEIPFFRISVTNEPGPPTIRYHMIKTVRIHFCFWKYNKNIAIISILDFYIFQNKF